MSYVELQCRSNFSFLRGASHPEELVRMAREQGLAGLALTDRNGVYGMPRGYRLARSYESFRYICGAEIVLADHTTLTLIAQNREAYGRLTSFLTYAKQGQEKGVVGARFQDFSDFFSSAARGLTVLPRWENRVGAPDQLPAALDLHVLRELFGRENVHLPLTFYLDGNDQGRVRRAQSLAREYEFALVASNDVEYHVKARKRVQDVLVAIREGQSLPEVGFRLSSNGERYLKSFAQMKRLYKDFPEALANTLQIAEACIFSPSELRYRYPSEWIPAGYSAQAYLEHLVETQALKRYPQGPSSKAREQMRTELAMIAQLSFADYFLTIYDIVDFAKRRDILCQGRGSAANSIVCYILGITAIDPAQMDLLFERFISVERGEPPDIDIDFEHERREEVLQYIYAKYGRERAAMVSAVVTYQYRSAFREVAKAYGVPVGTLSAKKVEQQFAELTHGMSEPAKLHEHIDKMAREIEGFPRHLTIHSGGFTLSADPITNIVPVEPARMEGRTIIQWDKYDLDTLGLIKVDVLALGMLSCLSKVLKMVGKKLYEIPHDDKPTYEMIQRCETVGTFQVESRAQMSMLGRLKPANFYDLVVEVAIVRPGPIVGDMVHPYLRRRQGLEKVHYPNAAVERILGRTLGVPLFQEQIMKLAIELAGFTPGEADILRKSINAWRSSESLDVVGGRLMAGLLRSGMSQEFADQIFRQIQGFSHYGFPESHAASFALLAYASCYLKCHHPAEFACGLVNSQPMGFYRPDTILYEAMRAGTQIKPVSILKSEWDCTIEAPGVIRLGFRLVNGLGKADVERMLEEREREGFASLADFVQRSRLKRAVIERLALAGRFEDFAWREAREALWALLEYHQLLPTSNTPAQLSLFNATNIATPTEAGRYAGSQHRGDNQLFRPLGDFEKVQSDYEAFAVSVHGHPMAELRRQIKGLPKMTSVEVRAAPNGSKVAASGLVLNRQKPPTAKGVCFATLEDESGFIDLVLWPDVFERFQDVFLHHCFIAIEGVTHKDGNTVSVVVKKIRPVWATATMHETPLALEPDQYFY